MLFRSQKEQAWRLQQEDMEQLPSSKLLQIIQPFCSRIGQAWWSSDGVGQGVGGSESGPSGGLGARGAATVHSRDGWEGAPHREQGREDSQTPQ